ncbi:Sec-independent protein translocase subunit TatA [Sciscionella sediminilitoris]|uniref:Sec-independent protein translocase subunit TatA n=1 Tax=Sciscionella sediminilitoris TaxID=1445613 RepID=UPI0004DF1A76|nr:Sec-independent protein translocase subunit TatA [Sciscionella sp. SE31]
MFSGLQGWHIIVIVVAIVLLFGAKRLPDAAKGIGKSLRIFKSETKAMREQDGEAGADATAPAAEQLPSAQPNVAPQQQYAAPQQNTAAQAEQVSQQAPQQSGQAQPSAEAK